MKIYLWKSPFPKHHDEMTFAAYANSESEAKQLIIAEMSKSIANAEGCFNIHTMNRQLQVVSGIALWLGDPYHGR